MCSDERFIIINGKKWKDVSNVTHAGISYPLWLVQASNGNIPTTNSN